MSSRIRCFYTSDPIVAKAVKENYDEICSEPFLYCVQTRFYLSGRTGDEWVIKIDGTRGMWGQLVQTVFFDLNKCDSHTLECFRYSREYKHFTNLNISNVKLYQATFIEKPLLVKRNIIGILRHCFSYDALKISYLTEKTNFNKQPTYRTLIP